MCDHSPAPPASTLICIYVPDTPPSHTLSLHDALPIWIPGPPFVEGHQPAVGIARRGRHATDDGPADRFGIVLLDRKSTRLNSSHGYISYAVFCLKKKNIEQDVEEQSLQVLGVERKRPV